MTNLAAALLAVAFLAGPAAHASEAERSPDAAVTVPAALAGREAECRQACASWLAPQCSPETMRRGETMFECASRIATIFDGCMRQCRR